VVGHLRLLAGMVRANRPWRAFAGLSSAVVAAFAAGAYAEINQTIWRLSQALSSGRLLAVTLISVVSIVAWLIIANGLWERPGRYRDAQDTRLYNAATALTITLAVLCGYAVLFLLILGVSGLVIDGKVFTAETHCRADLDAYLSLAWFAASIATVGGGLGSGLEGIEEVREAAYGHHQRRRDERSRP
jgi:hypothetical protein